jgi:hypothetical protein
MFEKETYRMVRGEMVLSKGIRNGTLYKFLGSTTSDGCNRCIVPDIGAEEGKNLIVLEKRLCYGIKDWGMLERRAFEYYTIKVWLKVCQISIWIFISLNIAYMESRIM